jgi:hypothetical protein
MFLFKRFFKQILLTALIGFTIRKLMSSKDPRAQRIGAGANKLVGGVIGLDENARPLPKKRGRRAAKSAATAAAGSAMSYFFDPVHGSERRAKVKRFANERMRRNGQQHLLPSASTTGSAPASMPTHAAAPGVVS